MKMQPSKMFFFLNIFLLLSIPFNGFAQKTRQEIVKDLFSVVEKWMGTPYVYGGNSTKGIDCSAFTGRVYAEVYRINIPRTVDKQKLMGKTVVGKLEPGDLLFFNIGGSISHVGVYVFDNKFIHAASAGPQVGVIKSSLNEKYYKTRFVYAKRLEQLPKFEVAKTNEPTSYTEDKRKVSDIFAGNDEDRIIKQSPEIVTFSMGRVIFNGEIIETSEEFDSERPINFSIENINHEKKYFVIIITNLDNEKKKKIHLFDVKKNKIIFKDLYLAEGNYAVKLQSSNKTVLYERNIRVIN